MKQCTHIDIKFRNNKCYLFDKETKKTISLGVEDHALFRMVDIRYVREHALVAKSASNIDTLWH
jgi:hypothetical protein